MRIVLVGSAIVLSSLLFILNQKIDSQKSTVTFSISNLFVNTVEGSFRNFEGEASFDIENPEKSSFKIKIPVSSINTENEDRDKHLQAEEYFHSEKFPFVEFNSTFVNKTAEGIDISGMLKIKGVTKEFTIPFNSEKTKEGYHLTGKLEIDRFDFNVGSEGSFSMGRKVELGIDFYIKN